MNFTGSKSSPILKKLQYPMGTGALLFCTFPWTLSTAKDLRLNGFGKNPFSNKNSSGYWGPSFVHSMNPTCSKRPESEWFFGKSPFSNKTPFVESMSVTQIQVQLVFINIFKKHVEYQNPNAFTWKRKKEGVWWVGGSFNFWNIFILD